jgi:hypothetical protein
MRWGIKSFGVHRLAVQNDEGEKRCRSCQTAAEKVLRLPMLRNQYPAAGLLASLTAAKTICRNGRSAHREHGEQFPFKDKNAHYCSCNPHRDM